MAKIISDSRQYFSLFSLYFQLWKLFQKSRCTLLWQITVFLRLSTTNSNTLIPGAKNSHEVKTDLHLRRPEFLRLPAGFCKPFQLTETRGFADHFLKISRSYSLGNLNYSNFPCTEPIGQLCCLAPYHWGLSAVCGEDFLFPLQKRVKSHALLDLVQFYLSSLIEHGKISQPRWILPAVNVGNRSFFFLRFCRTWTKRYLIISQTRVKRVSRIHHRTILSSRLRGD